MKSDRREIIKDLFRRKGEVKLRELEEIFPNCSSMTLRRDIKELEDEGLVKRTRGGAIAMSSLMLVTEDMYQDRASFNTTAKLSIAKHAAQFFEPGCSMFIDAGSTLMYLTRELPDEYCSIMTSGVNIALELLKKKNPVVTMIGGQLNRNTISVAGINSMDFIRSINIDIAFMGSSAMTLESGFTCGTYTDCGVKREVITRARKRVVLMDSSKFGKSMTFTYANISDIDVFITDKGFPQDALEVIRKAGVEVIVC
ncbi:MAG: DeoR/GlpR transcriptional regulator [Clostridiales bacterium]|nr:DeoR/GlpR transcriptional regulator [Clostridiales bacterium]MBP3940866.1 DeoR/GlpR transcriptional regulator [Christensenellaceae bacterium]MBR3841722.1 DeoR/GlpR transcriptional regulator [Christensenellaceae bacterium]